VNGFTIFYCGGFNMQLMKLNSIYAELRGDSWFDSEKSLSEELQTAMRRVMPDWLYAQANHLIEELYELDKGVTEHEDMFFMIDMDYFRSGMLEAHRFIIKQRNDAELAALEVIEGNDEEEFDLNAWLSSDE